MACWLDLLIELNIHDANRVILLLLLLLIFKIFFLLWNGLLVRFADPFVAFLRHPEMMKEDDDNNDDHGVNVTSIVISVTSILISVTSIVISVTSIVIEHFSRAPVHVCIAFLVVQNTWTYI